MKFLCDRCKTRYSIGDERVRGKILKIRCKNCNNVITVREGMPEISADEPRRKGQPTQALDAVAREPNGALNAAFASAMTKPPPALEEEWYVSIEGEQAGPFSLAEAQRWVASKPFEAELHCWSEGFDDWLPVDKVSHFRGLRKRPAAPPPVAVPPPLPRAATGAHRAVTRQGIAEDEPKPLFAATMASLEKATQPPLGSGNFDLPSVLPAASPAPASRGTPLGGQPALPVQARTNGSAAHRPVNVRAPFEPGESATQIDAPPISDEPKPAPTADPFAPTTPQPAKADPFATKPPLDLTQPIGDQDIDGDLDIGEVSRVVKLADLVKTAPPAAERAAPSRQSGQLPLNRTGSLATLPNRTGSAASIPLPTIGPDGKQVDPTTGEPVPLAPQVAVSHRRGMIALLVGALVLLGAAGAAVIYIVTADDDTGSTTLSTYDINTMRPDDPRRRTGSAGVQPEDPDSGKPQNPFVPRPRPRPNPTPTPPPNPNAKDLRPDEIEEMAGKNSASTQMCWRRSQRGAEAIILGDLKKLGVTLTVDKNGAVTTVTLSDHATTSLGKCLIASIKGWKFRESTSGITARITLVFQGV